MRDVLMASLLCTTVFFFITLHTLQSQHLYHARRVAHRCLTEAYIDDIDAAAACAQDRYSLVQRNRPL